MRTCRAIEPILDQWLDRPHGELSFHATQLVAGHGCFQTYLHRIAKAETATCVFCEREDDSPDHTLQSCENWSEQRELLISLIGQDLSLETIIRQMLMSEENWKAFLTFADDVMLAKEEEERARERARIDDSESDPS